MINIRKIGGVMIIALCMIYTAANAQEIKLNKEIVVDKVYLPTETEADKLNLAPNQVEITIEQKELDYSNWAVPTTVSPTIQTLAPIEYEGTQSVAEQRGYLQLGLGTYLNSNSAVGYRVVDKEKTKLNIWGVHTSTWLGENNSPYITATDSELQTQEFNNAILGLSLTQLLKGGNIINADVYYHYDRFNYYDTTTELDMQSVNEINVDLSFSQNEGDRAINFWGGLEYNYWGNDYSFLASKDAMTENQFNLLAGAGTTISGIGDVELELEGKYLLYNNDLSVWNEEGSASNLLLIGVTPAYKYKTENLAVQLGVKLDYSAEIENYFRVSPAVKLDYQFNKKVSAYIYMLGGNNVNSFAELAAKNRYFNPSLYYGTTYTPFDANLGFKFVPVEGLKGDVSFGYAKVNNQMLPYYFKTGMTTIYDGVDMVGYYVGADLEYSYKTLGSAKVGVKYAPQEDIDKGYATGDDRAELVLNAEVAVTPIDKLRAAIGYEYRRNRAVWGYSSDVATSADLGDVNNLYLNVSYKINDRFNVYTNINNILFEQWDNYYGMGAQKLGAIVGVSLLF